MSVFRSSHWKQNTPRMQLVGLLQSVWGNISNVRLMFGDTGVFRWHTLPEGVRIALEHLEEAQTILKQMPEGDWEKPKAEKPMPKEHAADCKRFRNFERLCDRLQDAIMFEGKFEIRLRSKPSNEMMDLLNHWFTDGVYPARGTVKLIGQRKSKDWDSVDECYTRTVTEYKLRLIPLGK